MFKKALLSVICFLLVIVVGIYGKPIPPTYSFLTDTKPLDQPISIKVHNGIFLRLSLSGNGSSLFNSRQIGSGLNDSYKVDLGHFTVPQGKNSYPLSLGTITNTSTTALVVTFAISGPKTGQTGLPFSQLLVAGSLPNLTVAANQSRTMDLTIETHSNPNQLPKGTYIGWIQVSFSENGTVVQHEFEIRVVIA